MVGLTSEQRGRLLNDIDDAAKSAGLARSVCDFKDFVGAPVWGPGWRVIFSRAAFKAQYDKFLTVLDLCTDINMKAVVFVEQRTPGGAIKGVFVKGEVHTEEQRP